MIEYKDFAPVTDRGFFSSNFETLSSTLARANQWINDLGLDVINVETVVLPNVLDESHASHGALAAPIGATSIFCVQVVRIWYRAQPPRPQRS